jgi:hypothetical protein
MLRLRDSPGETGKLLGASWNNLNKEEKRPYVALAAQAKMRAGNVQVGEEEEEEVDE